MMSFIDDYASALLVGAVTLLAVLGAKLHSYKTRLDAAEAKAADYDALSRRLAEAKSLYYQRERSVAGAQKELVESARKRKAAEAHAAKLLRERDAAREITKDFAATTRVVDAMQSTTAHMSRQLAEAARQRKEAEAAAENLRRERDGKAHTERELQDANARIVRELDEAQSETSARDATIDEYKEALKLAVAGAVEKMRDELEQTREELEEAKRDRELAINFAGGATDDVAKAAGEAVAAHKKVAMERAVAASIQARATAAMVPGSLNIRIRDATSGEETFFRIKKTTKFQKVFNAYSTRKAFHGAAVRFLFDGARVDGEQTAEDIDMKDGDQLDCLYELLHITIGPRPTSRVRSRLSRRPRSPTCAAGWASTPGRGSSSWAACSTTTPRPWWSTASRPVSRSSRKGGHRRGTSAIKYRLVLTNYLNPPEWPRPAAGALPKRVSTPGKTHRTSGTSQHTSSR